MQTMGRDEDGEIRVAQPRQPAAGDRDRPRDVAAAPFRPDAPAVEGGEGPRVDHGDVTATEFGLELRGADRGGRCRFVGHRVHSPDWMMTGGDGIASVMKKPLPGRGPE